jgi:choline dehydrogenase-like flavoprotein
MLGSRLLLALRSGALRFSNIKFTLFYKAVQLNVLAGRASVILSGSTLRGGSSINLMQYSRGQHTDYDGQNATS